MQLRHADNNRRSQLSDNRHQDQRHWQRHRLQRTDGDNGMQSGCDSRLRDSNELHNNYYA